MRIINLPYVREPAEEYETRFGFMETSNLDLYKDVFVRAKVVVRVDILANMKNVFSEQTVEKFRPLVYGLISGNTVNKEKISKLLIAMCREDKVFNQFVSELYYFNFILLKPEVSFYSLLMYEISEIYKYKRELQFSVIDYYKYSFIAEDKGYVYYAANDTRAPIFISRGVKGELWSCAKNWTCQFQEC